MNRVRDTHDCFHLTCLAMHVIGRVTDRLIHVQRQGNFLWGGGIFSNFLISSTNIEPIEYPLGLLIGGI